MKTLQPPAETATCPYWCDGDHPSQAGVVHRREVGFTLVDAQRVFVVIHQSPDGKPSVAITGAVYVEVHHDDYDDLRTLLEMCGQPALGALVARAVEIWDRIMGHVQDG